MHQYWPSNALDSRQANVRNAETWWSERHRDHVTIAEERPVELLEGAGRLSASALVGASIEGYSMAGRAVTNVGAGGLGWNTRIVVRNATLLRLPRRKSRCSLSAACIAIGPRELHVRHRDVACGDLSVAIRAGRS